MVSRERPLPDGSSRQGCLANVAMGGPPTSGSEKVLANTPTRLWWVAAVLLLCLLAGSGLGATAKKKVQARAEFQKAEQLRTKLEAKPEARRKTAEYLAVIRHYDRAVHLGPTIGEADDSVFAAAELWAEKGELFDDPQALRRAAEKYRFLIREYPYSRFGNRARLALKKLETAASREKGPAKLARVTQIRHWATSTYTRVVVEVDRPVKYRGARIASPERIFFDLYGARLSPKVRDRTLGGDDSLVRRIRVGQNQVGITRVVLEVGWVHDYAAFVLPNPFRLVVDINGGPAPKATVAARSPKPTADGTGKHLKAQPKGSQAGQATASSSAPSSPPAGKRVAQASRAQPSKNKAAGSKPSSQARAKETKVAAATPPPPRPARPTSSGKRSLTRALGLKIGRIVIDPGHGGHDTGTIGPTGLMEKKVVLDVAQRLGALLKDRLGSEVVYTRQDDRFVSLEKRTAIANQKQADLFVSIHANSSRNRAIRGIETYYLNFTSSPHALEVAARENAVSEKSIHQLQDLVKKITLKEKLEESREFASQVQRSLVRGMARRNGLRNRGVKKAPFIVLIGAQMPSILAEISFLSNRTDERLLRKSAYRQKMAESLYRGVQRYANSLAGVKVAQSR